MTRQTFQFNMSDQQQIWTRPAGSVERQSYDINENISVVIAPARASSITLEFTSFDTEEDYDFVTIKSCTAVDCLHSTQLGRYSGSMIPDPVTSDTGIMLIEWLSDETETAPGWSANWSSVDLGGSFCHHQPTSQFTLAVDTVLLLENIALHGEPIHRHGMQPHAGSVANFSLPVFTHSNLINHGRRLLSHTRVFAYCEISMNLWVDLEYLCKPNAAALLFLFGALACTNCFPGTYSSSTGECLK
jgi:hypothetical protein